MERRVFGPTSREVAVIGEGTWNFEKANRNSAVTALRAGLDLGMDHIDTAEMYGSGVCEEMVAEAIAGRRHEVFLVSKVLPQNASKTGTIASCEKSLRRLRTDRLDCYLLHWRGPYALADTFEAFEQLKKEGKILSWGVSNFDELDLQEAWDIAGEQMVCNQVLYHLYERAIEHEVIPWCEKHNVAVVAYSPFGSTGGFPGPQNRGWQVLHEIADAHGATPRQVALRFLLRRQSVFAIPKAASVVHARENAAAGDLQLTKAEIERIEQTFPLGSRPSALPMI